MSCQFKPPSLAVQIFKLHYKTALCSNSGAAFKIMHVLIYHLAQCLLYSKEMLAIISTLLLSTSLPREIVVFLPHAEMVKGIICPPTMVQIHCFIKKFTEFE